MDLKLFKIAMVGLIMVSLYSCGPKDFTCTLVGTVVDRKSDTLMLKRVNEDFRFVKIFIPVVGGKFEYKMEVKDIEAWDLTFKSEYDNGGWRPIKFFPDQRTINIELHPTDQFDKNKVLGGKCNQASLEFDNANKTQFDPRREPLHRIQDSLGKIDQIQSEEMKQVFARYQSATTEDERKAILGKADSLRKIGKELSPAMLEVEAKQKLIQKEIIDWRYAYIKKNRNLFSYSLIVYDLLNTFKDVDIQTIKAVYPDYASKYPKHPYTTLCAAVLEGNDSIRVGGKLIDFTLPDLDGNKQTLSELIKGKVALIDLWATWCGPCILESRTMAPVYNDFRDKGFTIVGVAAEFRDTKAMKQRIEKEKWPWINLVDLDQQNHIWDIYGISGSGGRIFLVDQKGVILAINPSADEVRKRLEER